MRLEKFMSLKAGDCVSFEDKECVVTDVKTIRKSAADSEVDSLTGERAIYRSLHSARELELSYVDTQTGHVGRLCLVVFPDCPNSPQNIYILSRIRPGPPVEGTT